jgi:hypothetical protein
VAIARTTTDLRSGLNAEEAVNAVLPAVREAIFQRLVAVKSARRDNGVV